MIKEAGAHLTADNHALEWVMKEESYDIYAVEIRNGESRVNPPDR